MMIATHSCLFVCS